MPSGNPKEDGVCSDGVGYSPPGIPTGFCHKAQGCATEALPWVNAQHINNPEGVVPSHHTGRFVERVPMRPNGQRYDWFGLPRSSLCRASLPFVASAQPRCGCCDFPIRTRGNAGDGVTPGCRAQRPLALGKVYPQMAQMNTDGGNVGNTPSGLPEGALAPIRRGGLLLLDLQGVAHGHEGGFDG